MKLEALNDKKLGSYVAGSNMPTVLFFYSKKSRPARAMRPVLEEVAEGYSEMIRFAQVEIEESVAAVNQYGILSLPTYLVFKNGKLADRFIGLRTKENFTERIEESLQRL